MSDGGVKSARRVLDVLEYFAQSQRELSALEIAHHCGFPQSSTSALLSTLTAQGYLHYDGGRRTYMPTPRVALLGNWIGEHLFREGRVLAMMREVRDQLGQSVVLACENGLRAQYIHVIEGTVAVRMHPPIGGLRPLTRSGVGLLLLSTYDDARISQIVRRLNAEEADSALHTSLDELMPLIERIRVQGYSMTVNVYIQGGGTLAMRLPELVNGRPLAVGIAANDRALTQGEANFVSTLRNAIQRHLIGTE